jgi:potassium-transporting ATPase KdpC subunit
MMIKDILSSLFLYVTSLIMVALYCMIVYIAGHSFWQESAGGSLIIDQEQKVRGSVLLAQKTDSELYFMRRPNKKIDSKCDVALYNEALKLTLLRLFEESGRPFDISSLAPSASLLDPYITKREALIQASKISSARQIKLKKFLKIINEHALPQSVPFFELEIVNTTLLNSILDGYIGEGYIVAN